MASRVLNPNNYLKIGPQKAYVAMGEFNTSIQETVPDIFSCDLEGDKLILKEGYSEYKFPSGKTFHEVLEDEDFKIIKKMGEGFSNTTELVEIEGKQYLLRRPTYVIEKSNKAEQISETIRGGYFRECVHFTILSPSEYVMKIYAAESSLYKTAMLIEYVKGMTLTKWLESHPSKDEKKRVKDMLMKGLKYIHSKFIAHYDIKPDNIYVPSDTSKPPFFIDFGSSGRSFEGDMFWSNMRANNKRSLFRLNLDFTRNNQNKLNGGNRLHRKSKMTRKSKMMRQKK